MIVKEMTKTLKIDRNIEFRDSSGMRICIANSDSKGIEPYLDKEVTLWFSVKGDVPSLCGIDLVFYI